MDFPSFCELIVPFLIFWSPNGKDYEKMVFGGFSRFLAVFWVQKWNFQNFKIFKIGQKFDFHKICLNHYPMSYKHGKWFFGPPKHFFCRYIMIFIHLRQFLKNEFFGQKSTFSGFPMLQVIPSVLVGDDQNFEKLSNCVLEGS